MTEQAATDLYPDVLSPPGQLGSRPALAVVCEPVVPVFLSPPAPRQKVGASAADKLAPPVQAAFRI